MSILEYVLLVALVAMIAVGSLIYLGLSPAHVANNVGNVAVGDDAALTGASDPASGASTGTGDPAGGESTGTGDPAGGTSAGTPVKVWCTSGQSGCSDPVQIDGQTEVIHFNVTGGTGSYTYQLQGNVPPFVTPDWPAQEINVHPTDCATDLGTYNIALVVTDSAGDTGTLNFTLNVAKGSLCPG